MDHSPWLWPESATPESAKAAAQHWASVFWFWAAIAALVGFAAGTWAIIPGLVAVWCIRNSVKATLLEGALGRSASSGARPVLRSDVESAPPSAPGPWSLEVPVEFQPLFLRSFVLRVHHFLGTANCCELPLTRQRVPAEDLANWTKFCLIPFAIGYWMYSKEQAETKVLDALSLSPADWKLQVADPRVNEAASREVLSIFGAGLVACQDDRFGLGAAFLKEVGNLFALGGKPGFPEDSVGFRCVFHSVKLLSEPHIYEGALEVVRQRIGPMQRVGMADS